MTKNRIIDHQLYILGVGTSAGGIDALSKLLSSFTNADSNFAVIIVQHLSPNYRSELAKVLSKFCKWPVITAEPGMVVEKNKVYTTPQNKSISYEQGQIILTELNQDSYYTPSIDNFLISLATSCREYAIGVILSGLGSDGAKGLEAIKSNGGFTLAQSPGSAQYADMPKAAIQTTYVDLVLHPAKVFEEVNYYIHNYRLIRDEQPSQKSVDMVFNLLSNKCGVDFSQYKPTTILRRIQKRIEALHLLNISDYYLYLKQNPEELDKLFETVLIGVTEFFRDIEAFHLLKEQLKILLIDKKNHDSIRIWSVGCATGEEAYSIAILFYELMENNSFDYQLQIFASDIDERALNFARQGLYSKKSVEKLDPAIVEKYFENTEDGYRVVKTIKQHLLFCKHDISKDPPFVKLDLLVCRNLLIYFNSYLQKETLRIFNYSLKLGGLLFLGKSESVSVTGDLFAKTAGIKLFRKTQNDSPPNLLFSKYKISKSDQQHLEIKSNAKNMSLIEVVKESLFFANPNPFVVITENGDLKESQGSLRLYLEINQGTLNANIYKMANKELVTEIRGLIAQVKKQGKTQFSRILRFHLFDKEYFVRMKIYPTIYPTNGLHHYIIEFEDINPNSTFFSLTKEFNADNYESLRIGELEQEVISLREHLETFTEELETSNEEMQAVNEELQSSNEELKSSNEELETSNEELQSSNEELHAANNELRHANNLLLEKEEELKKAKQQSEENEILYRTISENIPNGTIGILNEDFRIEYVAGKGLQTFELGLEELIGQRLPDLNPSEVDRDNLNKAFTKALNGEPNISEFKYNEKIYTLRSIPFKYLNSSERKVMYLTQEITDTRLAEEKVQHNQLKFQTLADNIPVLCWMATADGYIYWYNSRWYEFTGTKPEEMEGWGWQSVHDPEVLPEVVEKWTSSIEKKELFEMVFPLKGADGIYKKFLTRIVPIKDQDGIVQEWFGTNTDITDRENIADQKDEFMGIASHELKTPVTSIKGFIQLCEVKLKKGNIEEVKPLLSKANHHVDKLTSLINDLFDVSKLKAGKLDFNFTEFNFKEALYDCVEQVRSHVDEIDVVIEDEIDFKVYADRLRIEQVIVNLLSNAIKYSRDTKKIIITISADADKIYCSVRDFGIGVPEEKLKYLFDKFYRVENNSFKYQGMGIGLYICLEIINRHGGQISVKSKVGEGSEFTFALLRNNNLNKS